MGKDRPKKLNKKPSNGTGHVRIGTWNVGSMTGKGVELAQVLKKRKINIACVQETKWTGKSTRALDQGYRIYYVGENTKKNGVGIILAEELQDKVISITRVNDRIIVLKLVIDEELWNIVSAYAPQVGYDETEKDKFWDELDNIVAGMNRQERIVIGADLNGHVGKKYENDRVHGGHGYGELNAEGERIVEMAQSNRLFICNTGFRKKDSHLITYTSGIGKSQIDYIMVRQINRESVIDCKAIPGEEIVKQHKLVIITCRKTKMSKIDKISLQPKIKMWKLKGENVLKYQECVKNSRSKATGNSDGESKWNNMKDIVIQAAAATCGVTKGGSKNYRESWWWNAGVQTAVKQKKEAYKLMLKQSGTKEQYKEKCKIAKKAVAQAKQMAADELCAKLDTKEGEKILYKIAENRARDKKDVQGAAYVKDENGNVLTANNEIKQRWKDYFDNLLNVENDRDTLESIQVTKGPTNQITKEEVHAAMKRMKCGKASGPSGVAIELLKVLGEEGIDWLLELLQRIWQEEKIPEDWKLSEIVPIYKQKGDPMECGNNRGIKLLEHVMKLLERILDTRLRKIVSIDESQFGFMQGKGTTDAIFIVRQMQEKFLEKRKKLYYCFVDLEKAYDRVPRELIYWSLRKKGVPEEMITKVKMLYTEAKTRIRTSKGPTNEFHIKVGLHQGSALSPFLFVTILDAISQHCRIGIPWELLFADDLVIIATSKEELQRRWLKWKNSMESVGLKVNIGKTEVLVASRDNENEKVYIKDEQGISLKQCDCFKYLGSAIDEKGTCDEAVKGRVKSAWGKWWELSRVLYDKHMPLRFKSKIYKTIIRPVMLYGAESWTVKKKDIDLLERTEMKMLRRLKGVTLRDKIRSESIRNDLGVMSIRNKVRENRLRWFGHVIRKPDEDKIKVVYKMEVDGKRKQGRPNLRWRDNIKKDLTDLELDEELANDRSLWRLKTRAADPRIPGTRLN